MPLAIELLTMNQAVSEFHIVKRLEIDFQTSLMMVTVLSYASEAAYLAGGSTVQSLPIRMPLDALAYPVDDSVHAWLTTDESSPFIGAEIVPDNANTLDAAQDRAWSRMKVIRTQRESGNFVFEDGIYQADVPRITGAATLALMAQLSGTEFSTTWTLTDNSVRSLTGAQVMGLGVAVGKYVDDLYNVARVKRAQIYAATSIANVNFITWLPEETVQSIVIPATAPDTILAAATQPVLPTPDSDNVPVTDTLALVPLTP